MGAGGWQALWIGEAPDTHYAAFHPAAGQSSTGIVLVPPLFHEMPRSRRFLTEVASELAGMGYPCLRFDFLGTGDSAGTGESLDLDTMCAGIDLAVASLRELAGVRRVVPLAWRAGAWAVQAWRARGEGAQLVMFWEPVVDGDAWMRELVAGDRVERSQRPPSRPGVARTSDEADGQLMGFPVSQRLRRQFADESPGTVGAGTVWAVLGDGGMDASGFDRTFGLPAGAPGFSHGAAMDATFFLTPAVRQTVGALGRALREDAPP